MASKIVFFALFALCVSQIAAKPSQGGDNLQELATQTQGVFNTFNEEFKKIFEIKDTKETKEFTDTIKKNADEFAGKLSQIVSGINTELKAHSGEAENAVKALKEKVSETVTKIQEAHPTEAAKAKEYQQQIEKAYNDIYAKAKDAATAIAKDTSGIQEDLAKFTENIMKEAKSNADKLSTELKKSLEQHSKAHKA